MSEKIVDIKEVVDYKIDGKLFDGFVISTDVQKIELLIESDTKCCEEYGYFICEDNIEDFIGASLLFVKIVDENRCVQKLPRTKEGKSVMFVNIMTDNGLIQFAAYNAHNGHYGHLALVNSTQVEGEDYL